MVKLDHPFGLRSLVPRVECEESMSFEENVKPRSSIASAAASVLEFRNFVGGEYPDSASSSQNGTAEAFECS